MQYALNYSNMNNSLEIPIILIVFIIVETIITFNILIELLIGKRLFIGFGVQKKRSLLPTTVVSFLFVDQKPYECDKGNQEVLFFMVENIAYIYVQFCCGSEKLRNKGLFLLVGTISYVFVCCGHAEVVFGIK